MKHEKGLTLLCGTLLAFVLSFSCTACVATAFELPTEGLADLRTLALWCALISMLCSICHIWRFGGLFIFAALTVFAVYLWFYGTLELSVEALCNTISIRYNNGYHWGILHWSGANLQAVDRTMALQGIGSVVAMSASWTVCRRRPAVWAIIAGLLPLLSCTILTTTVPEKAALFLWLLAIVLLLLTQSVRRRNARQANKLTLYAAIPAILALVMLFRMIPQEGYTGADRAKRLLQGVETLLGESFDGSGGGRDESVNLSRVGRTTKNNTPVMNVTATFSDTCYLRGRAYDIYTGTQWKDSGIDYGFPWPILERDTEMFPTQPHGSVTIATRNEEEIMYLPYYTESMLQQSMGSMQRNDGGLKRYSFDRYLLSDLRHHDADNEEASYITGLTDNGIAYLNRYNIRLPNENAIQAMTALPEDTRLWAEEKVSAILAEAGATTGEASPDAIAGYVCAYLKNYGRYDLNTPRMGAGQTDFVYWFLTKSDTGYCVHYASAAVVLLRAAGIPSRYVSGFTVDTKAGETVTVPQNNAHAWVEYWTIDHGWKILDPTPSTTDETPAQTTEPMTEATTEAATESTTEEMTVAATVPTENNSVTEKTTVPTESSGINGAATEAMPESGRDLTALFCALRWLGYVIMLVGLIVGQWKLRVFLHRRACKRGAPNTRALCCWRQALRYACALGEKPASELKELALKAKFSQYVLTDEELQRFESYFSRAIDCLRQKPVLLRLIYRLVLALY